MASTRPELKGSILLVCSGNICRSPAAMALLAEALHGLPVEIESAGLQARAGMPIEPRMLAALGDRLPASVATAFRSRPLSLEMLEGADLVLTATRSQRSDVVRLAPAVIRRTFTLLEFAELATDVASMVHSTGEPRPQTVADFVALTPQVRGTRQLDGPLDVVDPMGRSARTHVKVVREIDAAVAMITGALLP